MPRPRIEINKEMFESLCGIFCTLEEIACIFKCSEDTIERWCKREYKKSFADVYKKESMKGKASIRRTQFELAKRSVPMAIWLGKQYLGQRDVVEQVTDDASTEILNEIANEIRKAKDERINQTGSDTIPS